MTIYGDFLAFTLKPMSNTPHCDILAGSEIRIRSKMVDVVVVILVDVLIIWVIPNIDI